MEDLCNLQRLLQPRGVAARLSREADIPKGTIGSWKSGANEPSAGNYFALTKFFGYSKEVLLSRDASLLDAPPETQKSPSPEGEGEESVLDAELMRVIAGKSDETKRAVLALLQDSQPDKKP